VFPFLEPELVGKGQPGDKLGTGLPIAPYGVQQRSPAIHRLQQEHVLAELASQLNAFLNGREPLIVVAKAETNVRLAVQDIGQGGAIPTCPRQGKRLLQT